jgi:spermidine synthase
MLPWIHLDTADTPGGGVLRLLRRGDEFSIRLANGAVLMSSRLSGSEEALATLSWARIKDRPAPRVMIGGLGMGFTLRAVQAVAGPDAALTVAELSDALVGWAKGPMAQVFDGCLDDPRTAIRLGDVAALIAEAPGAWDAILLDVDNGPDGLTIPSNEALYSEAGLMAARRALAPGGVLAVWSAAPPEPWFTKRLRQCGFDAEAVPVRAGRSKRGARHTVWVAVAPGG